MAVEHDLLSFRKVHNWCSSTEQWRRIHHWHNCRTTHSPCLVVASPPQSMDKMTGWVSARLLSGRSYWIIREGDEVEQYRFREPLGDQFISFDSCGAFCRWHSFRTLFFYISFSKQVLPKWRIIEWRHITTAACCTRFLFIVHLHLLLYNLKVLSFPPLHCPSHSTKWFIVLEMKLTPCSYTCSDAATATAAAFEPSICIDLV